MSKLTAAACAGLIILVPTTAIAQSISVVEGTALEFTEVSQPEVEIRLTFAEKKGTAALVRLQVLPFASAGRAVGTTLWDGASEVGEVRVPANGMARVFLRATLVEAGTYRAVVRPSVTIRNKLTWLPDVVVTVRRARSQLPVELVSIPAILKEVNWGDGPVAADFVLYVWSTGRQVLLSDPVQISATRKPKADSAAGHTTQVKVTKKSAEPVVVHADKPASIAMLLTDIPGPGRYDATLRFVTAGYSGVDAAVTAYVRQPWHYAFGFIFFGVAVSFLVHAYTKTLRPRLIVQSRVIAWRAQLAQAAQDARGEAVAAALVSDVEARIEAKWKRASDSRLPVGAALDAYEDIVPALPQWIALHRQVSTVRPASARTKPMATLAAAKTEFVKVVPDVDAVRKAVESLHNLPAQIRSAVGEALGAEVITLDGQLTSDSRPAMVEVRNLLRLVRAKIEDGYLEAAVGSFDAARLRYVAIFAEDLRARVAGARPQGFTEPVWSALHTHTIADLEQVAVADADAGMDILVSATSRYLRSLAATLVDLAQPHGKQVTSRVDADVAQMESALGNGNLPAAWTKVRSAQQTIDSAIQDTTGGQMGAGMSAAAAATGVDFDPVAAFDLPPSWAYLGSPSAAAVTRSALTFADVLISLVVLVVAGLIGVQTLWVDNLTWGGGAAFLAAFLWGFAADQFTHAGITALGRK